MGGEKMAFPQQKPYVSREVMRERIRSVAISMPIYQNAAYAHPGLGKVRDMIIPAAATPPEMKCRRRLPLLEQGTEALAFSTGMAAITALMEILFSGDHLIATDDLYGGTLRLWNIISHKNGISVDYCRYLQRGHREGCIAPGDKGHLSGDSVQPYDESGRYSGHCRCGA